MRIERGGGEMKPEEEIKKSLGQVSNTREGEPESEFPDMPNDEWQRGMRGENREGGW